MIRIAVILGGAVEWLLLPKSCAFCGVPCAVPHAPVCDDCFADLPWIESACAHCATPVAEPLSAAGCCGACQLRPPSFDAAVAPLHYAFPINAAIKVLKFNRRLHYLPAFAHLLDGVLSRLPADVDALVPVPLHWRRHAYRGFNQSAELARLIGKRTGLETIHNVRRCRATPFQSGLTATQRRHNLQAAFVVRGELQARHPLIVDDVITTSATCSRLTQVLLAAGAEKVSVLALARASPG